MYITVELGDRGRVSVDEDKITIGRMKDLAQGVVDVKKAHTPLKDYPLNEGETVEEWEARISKEDRKKTDKEDTSRRDGEDSETYLNRIMNCESDDIDLYFDMLNMVFEKIADKPENGPFKQGPIPRSAFEEASVPKLVDFFRKIFSKAKINIEAVFPKRFDLPTE